MPAHQPFSQGPCCVAAARPPPQTHLSFLLRAPSAWKSCPCQGGALVYPMSCLPAVPPPSPLSLAHLLGCQGSSRGTFVTQRSVLQLRLARKPVLGPSSQGAPARLLCHALRSFNLPLASTARPQPPKLHALAGGPSDRQGAASLWKVQITQEETHSLKEIHAMKPVRNKQGSSLRTNQSSPRLTLRRYPGSAS